MPNPYHKHRVATKTFPHHYLTGEPGAEKISKMRYLQKKWILLGLLPCLSANFANAALLVEWESPAQKEPKLLKSFDLTELESRSLSILTEKDPLTKSGDSGKFQGLSLSALINEVTQSITAADRSTMDLVVLRTRSGKEVLMPKAFLVKYPQIQVAFKKDGKSLGSGSPRLILPATTNSKIQKENMLLEPMFVSELASVTLTSYERRYGAFFLKRRTDPAAMRGEKLFLQNCVTCHTQPQVAMAALTSAEKIQKVAQGEHPDVPGNHGFKAIFDKKAIRSLVSYLEAFKFQTAQK